MKKASSWLILLLSSLYVYPQNQDALRLNQIQIIGSHNSYKKPLDPRVMKFLMKLRDKLGKENNPIGVSYARTGDRHTQ
jgi:hypothetical protein